MTKEHPIIFNTAMMQALIAGRKTQTRRLGNSPLRKVQVGDKLWVRETLIHGGYFGAPIAYAADHKYSHYKWPSHWKRHCRPSIHMPRWASRITLTVTDVRLQRLQDITEEDVIAEGISECDGLFDDVQYCQYTNEMGLVFGDSKPMYRQLWASLYGKGSWDANPEVVALTFEVEVRE